MLKSFLQHHATRAMQGVPYNALHNCHVKGLDSIVLHDEPGNRIRMFIADRNHELHTNESDRMTLAVHAHHCDVRFINIVGEASNNLHHIMEDPHGAYREMDYVSAITTGTAGSLTPTGRRGTSIGLSWTPMSTNPTMQAHQQHTIHAPMGGFHAWLVIEGAEDPNYKSTCWTRNEKMGGPLVGLYVPMKQVVVAETLVLVANNCRA